MSENKQGSKSLIDEFKTLKPIQWVAIVLAIVIGVVLEVLGFGIQCFGFAIIAILLYMIPHLMGVMSPKVKAVIGVAFILVALPVGTLMYDDYADSTAGEIGKDSDHFKNVSYDDATGTLSVSFSDPGNAVVEYGVIDSIAFGAINCRTDKADMTVSDVKGPDNLYHGSVVLNLNDGKLYYVKVSQGDNWKSFTVDTGISSSDSTKLSFYGTAIVIAYVMIIFFFMLAITTAMRKAAYKARDRLESEGRLYPQGYGRCKECGALVLPGEVVCRKCGTYIEVPDEIKVHKKDYFTCESCGAEVPADAKVCPRCGVTFDSVETEIIHADGTKDVTEETFECSECGAQVPANAKRCPKCGAEFDDDDN